MKKYLFVFIGTLLLTSCGVRTSTPERDGAKLSRAFKAAKTLKDLDEAKQLFEKYKQAYEEEIYNGKRTIEDLKKLYECTAIN